MKTAEETQSDIKFEVSDLLIKPAQSFLSVMEPLAKQFKSIQQLKAEADGALKEADEWARRELDSARKTHRENVILWELAGTFAGPDGLLNYHDIKNTLECTPDAELKRILNFILSEEIKLATSYTRDALIILQKHINENSRLPPHRDRSNPLALLNPELRPTEVRNQIYRHMTATLAEQCAFPLDQADKIGTFDLLKKYCIRALDWRSQGIFAGLLNLQYGPESIDRAGSCNGRILTERSLAKVYEKYLVPKSNQKISAKDRNTLLEDFVTVQATKYFGPFETNTQPIQIYEPTGNYFLNRYIKLPVSAQVTLKGGLPVTAVKQLLDDFSTGKNNLLVGQLGSISRTFKTSLRCKAITNLFIPTKKVVIEKTDETFYRDETEFRAYFDPKFDGESYFKNNVPDKQSRLSALQESRRNKENATLNQVKSGDTIQFFHQSLSRVRFLGSITRSLTRGKYTKLQDGRVRLDFAYIEDATDGSLSVLVQRQDESGGYEVVEFEGYAIPTPAQDESLLTPCMEFSPAI